jgi:hypothetical protein
MFLDERIIDKIPEGFKIILPTAPFRPVMVAEGKMINSWFDIKTFGLPSEPNEQFDIENYN